MDRWLFEFQPDRDGHKFFFDLDSDNDCDASVALKWRVAIADRSGRTPDLTEDGVLYLDRSRPIQINVNWRGSCIIPLKRPNGESAATIASPNEAQKVAERFHLSCEERR